MNHIKSLLSLKRANGEASEASGRGVLNDNLRRAVSLRAGQRAAVRQQEHADDIEAVRQHSMNELYNAAYCDEIPVAVRHQELFGILFEALNQAMLHAGNSEGPMQYEPPKHDDDDKSSFFFSTQTELMPVHVEVTRAPIAEPASPIASRVCADVESPSYDLTAGHVQPVGTGTAGLTASGWQVAITRLHTDAVTALAALLCTYETLAEQTQKIIRELAGLQQRHYAAVQKLHSQMHPRSLAVRRPTELRQQRPTEQRPTPLTQWRRLRSSRTRMKRHGA